MSIFKDSKITGMIKEQYDNSEYIHVNIPSNDEAIDMYKEEIASLKEMKPDSFRLTDSEDLREFDETIDYLNNTLNYYTEINKIYEKTNFLIENPYSFNVNESGFSILISSEAKKCLHQAIDLLEEKINEFDVYQTMFISGVDSS